MKKINFYKLAVALALPQIAGFIGTIFTDPQIPTWYETLNQSALTPPNWTFGIVWPLLYILMGVAFYIVWTKNEGKNSGLAIKLFIVQLLLNTTWSVLFFGQQNPLAALWGILALWAAIVATIFAFMRVSKTAAWLMLPYILWVSFAFYLNYQVVVLN